MKRFFVSTAGRVVTITVIVLLVLCVFIVKTSQEKNELKNLEPDQAVAELPQNGLPVFIYFTAQWCGYCKEMEPIIEELRQEYSGTLDFITIDVNEQPQIEQQFGAKGVPLYVIIDADGNPISYFPGATTKEKLQNFIVETLESLS